MDERDDEQGGLMDRARETLGNMTGGDNASDAGYAGDRDTDVGGPDPDVRGTGAYGTDAGVETGDAPGYSTDQASPTGDGIDDDLDDSGLGAINRE